MHPCPVCGYPGLSVAPRGSGEAPSYERCLCCGFRFGVSDDEQGWTYEHWRADWIASGMRWRARDVPAPAGWEPRLQLAALRLAGSHYGR